MNGVVVFECESKQIADYLVKHGSKMLDIEMRDGGNVYIFEHDEALDKNIEEWEKNFNNSMFAV